MRGGACGDRRDVREVEGAPMAAVSGIAWDDTAQRLCGLARQYAFLFGEEFVGTEHLLLAAAEVTPTDWHGYPGLSRKGVLNAMDAVLGKPGGVELHERRPQRLTPRARDALRRAVERAAAAGRPVNCRDMWAGLLGEQEGLANEILSRLSVVPEQLRTRLA
jgi:Clp amino terminal domain, pathogenicity island component